MIGPILWKKSRESKQAKDAQRELARVEGLLEKVAFDSSAEIAALEQQLAEARATIDNLLRGMIEARAQALKEAAGIARGYIGELRQHVHTGFCRLCDAFYAGKAKAEEIALAIERVADAITEENGKRP